MTPPLNGTSSRPYRMRGGLIGGDGRGHMRLDDARHPVHGPFRTKSGCSIVRTRLWTILSKSTSICCPFSKSSLFTRSLGRTDCRNFSASGRDALLERALHVFLLLLGHVVPLESRRGGEGVRPEDAAGGPTAEGRGRRPRWGVGSATGWRWPPLIRVVAAVAALSRLVHLRTRRVFR